MWKEIIQKDWDEVGMGKRIVAFSASNVKKQGEKELDWNYAVVKQ